MTLTSGTRLGPYEILGALGAGGMGEVYKARDTRLDRTVAIKVLPDHLSKNEEVRQRFEREAKTISQLSHPHICALHDVGSQDGVEYLVMEYLEGETLAERLAKGPLPLEQTLRYGAEIADALEKAHRQGIVHRDLKPGNVMLTKSGVKLLDFGLAKAVQPSSSVSPLTSLPTQGPALTAEGTILGTFQYMAPEQLEGKEADARTDIFALGSVLYESATGKKAFSGVSQALLISAIMQTDPTPVSSAVPMAPPALDRVVKTCLAKDPEDRFQTAHDVRLELKWIAEGASQAGPAAPFRARRLRTRAPGVIAGFALGALAAALAMRLWRAPAPREPAQPRWLSIVLPSQAPLAAYGRQILAFAPDGSRIAYCAEKAGTRRLYVRSLAGLEPAPIPDSEGASSVFFSPDSSWLGFVVGNKLMKVPVGGGVPQLICEAAEIRGGSWGTDGTIVLSTGTSGLSAVAASGGNPRPLLKKAAIAYWPQILPGNETVIFTTYVGTSRASILSLKTGEQRDLIEAEGARYFRSGHLLFARSGSLFAAPFDVNRLELTGPPISMVSDVVSLPPFANPLFDLSQGGDLAYAPGAPPGVGLVWVDRNGKVEPLPFEKRSYEEPRVSPDGKRLAVTIRAGDADLWILDAARGASARLTFEAGEDETAVWTRDGKKVAYSADRAGHPRAIYWKPADGSGVEERLAETVEHTHVTSWSPARRTLAFTVYDPAFSGDIWTLTLGEKVEKRTWLRTTFNERAARFSPDGRWLTYVSDESGRDEVYVQAFPGPGSKSQISITGGTEPDWSHDGKEIFYRNGDKMMAVKVASGQTFSAEAPRTLFEGSFVPTRRGDASYDLSPDDRRFLMLQRDAASVITHLNVVLNFSEELRRRVPTGKRP